ncbi:hypothetical protein Cgig2_005121 [Carnegiea gigantea]|uniref:GDSL esterase/lipase n=1 Tax=Carnegiea gigantea TaxID=171969 RepID=A0A9Q1KDK6_9CARY|nr:hypothetical protein Cgig2_005121 [Carnegiea gigantea]
MKWCMLTLVVLALILQFHASYGHPQVPCFFIFGDSLSDSGNNNNLPTLAKANFLPYGIDFPGGSTGRFTNGRTTVDIIGYHLGLEGYIPPFASVKDSDINKGVNYASGSSGIRPETGVQVTLHETGARKVIVFGVGPLGCLPPITALGECSAYINRVLEMYNTKLKSLVDTLNAKFTDAKFIWINTIAIVSNDLRGLGLRVRTIPCCGAGVCLPLTIPCSNRGEFAYWDLFHPTEAANRVLADRAFSAKQETDAYPMDISHLAQL